MYQIKRTRIVEQLEIDDNGTKTVLDVDISADTILRDYNNAQYAIAQAQLAAQKAKSEKDAKAAEQALGDAILSLFKLIFGQAQLDQILQIYDNRPLEMLSDIAPFIAEVITPRIQEAQQRIQESYKRVKK
jgi:hypothetical protein